MSDNEAVIDGLRALADWYEAHPDMPAPAEVQCSVYALDSKEEATRVVAALGSCQKEFSESIFTLARDFGGRVALRFVFSRTSVCHRKVLGTRHVPESVVPAHDVDVVEWECEPVLR